MTPSRTLDRGLVFATLLATLLVGCAKPTADVQVGEHDSVLKHISIYDQYISVHLADGKEAKITANGALSVDSQAVALDAGQQALTRRYYADILALRSEGIAVGKAGAKLAGKAVGSVVQGLASGDPDQIGDKIERQADDLSAQALKLCERAAAIQATQEAIAQAVPAFTAYALEDRIDPASCRK